MASDIVLKDDVIELVDARFVRIKETNGKVLVKIEGRLVASNSVKANELTANRVTLGSDAAGEPKVDGLLRIKSRVSSLGSVLISRGLVKAKRGSFQVTNAAKVVVGQGAPSEPKVAGNLGVRSKTGEVGVEIQGKGDIKLAGVGSLKAQLRKIERRLSRLERR